MYKFIKIDIHKFPNVKTTFKKLFLYENIIYVVN